MPSPMSSSSDEDRPLAKTNGRLKINGTFSSPNSADTNATTPGPILPVRVSKTLGLRIDRNVEPMDIDSTITIANSQVTEVETANGNGVGRETRKKVRKPAVKGESGSEDSDEPLNKRRRTSSAVKKKVVESSDSDVPLTKKAAKGRKVSSPTGTKKPPPITEGGSSDSDIPLAAARLAKEKNKIQKEAAKTAKENRANEKRVPTPTKRKVSIKKEESDSDIPLKKKRPAPARKGGPLVKKVTPAKKNGVKKEKSSDDDIPLAKKAKAPKKVVAVKQEKGKAVETEATKGKGKVKEETPADAEEGEDEEEYRWWEHQAETDGTQKWTTLEHNGVIFPPPYEPLPSNVKMKYNGVDVTLAPEAEEIAGFFGAMLDSQHASNPKFCENFFKDFQAVLSKSGGARNPEGKKTQIKEFKKCDFNPMFEYFEAKKVEKKAMPLSERKALKAERDKFEEKYLYCLLDGRKEKVGNFRIEPPGLFRGRGEHPKTGMVKQRVQPEQVTINIGKGVPVPSPPEGHKWADVIHDNTVTWLATWKENINGNIKYVMLAATSSLKGMSDFKKFEKARELKNHINRIRDDYNRDLSATLMADRQRATAMYLIDKFALRAGNEKSDDEADTVGCCSLRFEHVTLEPPNYVIFDFLGKDSIRFYQKVAVIPQVFKNLRIFKKEPKHAGDMIFDRLDTTQLNKHLQNYMSGLSAKVFRTYNASWTMQQQLKLIPNTGSVHDKYAAYNEANRKVAILCNHQRTVSTTHGMQMQRVEEKIKALKYQKLRLKRQILFLEPNRKKKNSDYFKPDPEIDSEEWIREHQKALIEQEREKITKKFEKDNEKLVENKESELKAEVLEERLKVLEEMKAEFKEENKTGKVEPKAKGTTVEKIEAQIEKMDERIRKQETDAKVKEDNKTVALGTSKINYIDPRLTVMFCKKYNVPIEKVFGKGLRAKFKWALESADEDWEF